MKSKRLYDIISTILGLSKRKKKEFYDVLETIDEEGKIQANYDENDINSPSYIKNKEFYKEKTRLTTYIGAGTLKTRSFEKASPKVLPYGPPYYELIFELDFKNNLLKARSIGSDYIFKTENDKLYKRIFKDTSFVFDSSEFTYDGKTFVELKFVEDLDDRNIGITCGTNLYGSPNYYIAVNKNIDINNVQSEDIIAVYFGGSDNNSYKTYLTKLYDKFLGTTPGGDAKEYDLSVYNNYTTNSSIAFRYYGIHNDIFLSLAVDTYEIHQLPEEYVYNLIQRIEALEQSNN